MLLSAKIGAIAEGLCSPSIFILKGSAADCRKSKTAATNRSLNIEEGSTAKTSAGRTLGGSLRPPLLLAGTVFRRAVSANRPWNYGDRQALDSPRLAAAFLNHNVNTYPNRLHFLWRDKHRG
jgi:hypothetical protein